MKSEKGVNHHHTPQKKTHQKTWLGTCHRHGEVYKQQPAILAEGITINLFKSYARFFGVTFSVGVLSVIKRSLGKGERIDIPIPLSCINTTLRIQVCPKKGLTLQSYCGMGLGPSNQTYSREGYGSLEEIKLFWHPPRSLPQDSLVFLYCSSGWNSTYTGPTKNKQMSLLPTWATKK